ncbi:MAG: hypothetical protein QM703_17180 [Gemmatales bacterium]
MAELQWRTGKPQAEALELMKSQLAKTSYNDNVTWKDNTFTASIGMGFMLDIAGTVTDNMVTVEKCGGVSGGMALGKLKQMFEHLYPGGEVK